MLTLTAPLAFAGQSLALKDFLAGYDERSPLNLFWYDNTRPSQQRMAISVLDKDKVAINAGIVMDFPGEGSVKLLKVSEGQESPLAGAVFGVYDKETDELLCELTTDEKGEATATFEEGVYKSPSDEKIIEIITGADGTALLELELGEYYLRELQAPEGYKLNPSMFLLRIDTAGAVVKVEVANEPEFFSTPPLGIITIPKTGESPPYSSYVLATLSMGFAALCGAALYRRLKTAV